MKDGLRGRRSESGSGSGSENVCRRRKTRCDRKSPCSNCVRSRRKEACVYDEEPQQGRPRTRSIQPGGHRHNPAQSLQTPLADSDISAPLPPSAAPTCPDSSSASIGGEHASPGTDTTQVPHDNIDLMRSRIKHLEQQLCKATPRPVHAGAVVTPASDVETHATSSTFASKFAGTFHVHGGNPGSALFGRAALMSRSISHKTRLLGQSHWMNGAVPITMQFVALLEPQLREGKPKVLDIMDKCKTLGRIIKSQRAPAWPCPLSEDLPPKHLCDALVDRYLETIESIYRILHVPSFRRDYEAIWAKPDTHPENHFLVQLKLVLAIGAVTYDPNFSLRTQATRWVYEAQTYLAEPVFKSRLRIFIVQTRILHLLAMELVDVAGDSIWISAGGLIRGAITMGLHRDPRHLPEMTPLAAEMRRRLWNTILEVTLQASLSKGGPPLLSTADFDAEAPGNFEDEALTSGPGHLPEDHNDPTIMSIPRALRMTYPVRLKVTKFLNDHNPAGGTYEETIQLDTEVREALKSLRRSLHPLRNRPAARFAAHAAELIMERYLASLHMPYYAASIYFPAYAYSRQVILDVLLKIWCAVWPSSSIASPASPAPAQTQTTYSTPSTAAAAAAGSSPASSEELLARLITSGSGFFRTCAVQVSFTIPMELHAQLQDDEGLPAGPGARAHMRRDLAAVTSEVKAWSWRCLEAGESSVKGYLMASLLVAQTEALQRLGPAAGAGAGAGADSAGSAELARFLIREGQKDAEKAVLLLEAMVAATKQHGGAAPIVDEFGPSPGLTEDWDFTVMVSYARIYHH
ncbi:hypothetical protein KVR01_008121 [Diaporthe batatas]|uniref:uncharacterized protein n=1 Tax=Diaporthe batatas TaxID=748121 RepID=UPI001D035FD6|nr:uncharacterized protein KVR01_008121 [Diaporthe batatas]KAG8162356.1 hypothetical protein KVR01_008121 [Diaporthe batatas]